MLVDGPGTLEFVYTPANGGQPVRLPVHSFDGPGIALGMHNKDDVNIFC
jgi:isocitrate dehydrogenase